jgi:hypothetical protein
MRRRTKVVGVTFVSAALLLAALTAIEVYRNIPTSAEDAVARFHKAEGAEDQLMDPLILAGPAVIPLLERDLLEPGMPLKHYAIGALGNIGDRAALPVLRRLIDTEAEPEYVRCDALSALAMIDRDAALEAARKAAPPMPPCVGEIRKAIQDDYEKMKRLANQTFPVRH